MIAAIPEAASRWRSPPPATPKAASRARQSYDAGCCVQMFNQAGWPGSRL